MTEHIVFFFLNTPCSTPNESFCWRSICFHPACCCGRCDFGGRTAFIQKVVKVNYVGLDVFIILCFYRKYRYRKKLLSLFDQSVFSEALSQQDPYNDDISSDSDNKESFLGDKETVLEDKESVLEDNESVLEDNESFLEDNESVLEDVLEDKESVLEYKESVLEDKESVLEDKESVLEDKESVLEDKESVPEDDIKSIKEGTEIDYGSSVSSSICNE